MLLNLLIFTSSHKNMGAFLGLYSSKKLVAKSLSCARWQASPAAPRRDKEAPYEKAGEEFATNYQVMMITWVANILASNIPKNLSKLVVGPTHLKNIISSKWESSPNRGEHKKYLKPPPSFDLFRTTLWFFSPSKHLQTTKSTAIRWYAVNQHDLADIFIHGLLFPLSSSFSGGCKSFFSPKRLLMDADSPGSVAVRWSLEQSWLVNYNHSPTY